MSLRDTDVVRVVDIRFPLPKPLHLPQAVQHDRGRDRVQPGRKRGIAAERTKPVERPNERFLGEILREGIIAREPEGQAVYAVHVRVIERALCSAIPGADAGNKL